MSKKMKQFSQPIPKHLLENQLFLRKGLTIPNIHGRNWEKYIVLHIAPQKDARKTTALVCSSTMLHDFVVCSIFQHTHLFPHHYLWCALNNYWCCEMRCCSVKNFKMYNFYTVHLVGFILVICTIIVFYNFIANKYFLWSKLVTKTSAFPNPFHVV